MSDLYGLELPVPGGEVGARAPGFEPAAGSAGPVDGAGCMFSLVVGSLGIPAGELTPLSPVLDPSPDGAVVDGAMAGGFCELFVLS